MFVNIKENRFRCLLGKANFIPASPVKSEFKDENRVTESKGTKQLIKCPHCPKTFDQNFKMRAHLTVHKSDKPFTCSECKTGFKTNSAFRRHVRDIHEKTRKFSCMECGKEFNSKTNFVIHKRRHQLEFVVRCEYCNEGFVTNTEYRRHLDARHNKKEYVCDICGKSISSDRHLKEHRKIHEQNYEDRYFHECPICHKKFRHLKKHVRESHEGGGNNYICPTCGKTYRGENSFKVHLMIHKGDRPYQCDICRKGFYSKQYLMVHSRVHTGEKPYECEICGKCFAQKPPLKIHMRLHSGERPYDCDVCSEKGLETIVIEFEDTNPELINIQDVTAEWWCHKCGKCFPNKIGLNRHFAFVHFGYEKHFTCDQCGSYYKKKSLLLNHLRAEHIGALECQICGRRFKNGESFQNHVNKHGTVGDLETKNKADVLTICQICDKNFFSEQDYTSHMKLQHELLVSPCEVCGKVFDSSTALNSHMLDHSKDLHECTVCKKKGLEAHMRCTHEGGRKCICHVCGKIFGNYKPLKRHLMTHDTV